MALTFTSSRYFTTTANSIVACNQSQASFAFKLRYEPGADPAASGGCYYVARTAGATFSFVMGGAGTSANTVKLIFTIKNSTGQTATLTTNMLVGVVNCYALTYDQGAQILWTNGAPAQMNAFSGNTFSNNTQFQVGGVTAGPNCSYTLDDVAIWNGYVLTPAEIRGLRDGVLDPSQIGASATWRGYWTLDGTIGASAVIGDAGLANSFGHAPTNLTSVSGSGTAVYSAPLQWSPAVGVKRACVGTSGKTVIFYFKALSTEQDATPQQLVTAPTITINGGAAVALTTPWLTGYHRCMMFALPAGTVVAPGDAVTLQAPAGWMSTDMGLTQAVSNAPLENCSGRSAFGTESVPRTLRVGLNFPHLGTISWSTYQVPRNWVKRTTRFQNCTLDASFKPVATAAASARATLYDLSTSNGIDATSYPGPTGLFAIGWDDLNPAVPTSFSISTSLPSTTTVTERVDLANPGNANGTGKVRVFSVARAAASVTAAIQLDLWVSNANRTPQFSNLVVYGPGDFDYQDGVPTVLDRTNPLEPTATFRNRFPHGLGSARWVDSTIGFAGASSMVEPEELRDSADLTWGDGCYKRSYSFGYTQARPFVIGPSSYIYSMHFGEPFPATLAADIDATQTTLSISDADTAPVLEGLRLTAGSEIMRVLAVSGTTVTVERGSQGTTAAPHAAGPIQVNNRFLVTSLGQLAGGNGLVTELVTNNPHRMRSGQYVGWSGTWPTFTYTDGSTCAFSSYGRVVFVTGANSYVAAIFNSVGAPVTLSAPVALTPGSQYSSINLPDVGFPFEFVAQTTGSLAGCDLHVNVPHAASDSLVDEIARRVRDNFPPGRTVWVELSNETWNTFFVQQVYFAAVARMLNPQGSGKHYYVVRSDQVWKRFRDRFNEGGRNRGGEVKGLLNTHFKLASETADALGVATANSIDVGGVAIAPYVDSDNGAASVAAYNAYDAEQAADLWIHDLWHNTGGNGFPSYFAGHLSKIASYNQASGGNCVLYGYEGGVQFAFPGGVTNKAERLRDLLYNPSWYFIEQDFYAFLQSWGFVRENIYAYSMYNVNNTSWGLYHWPDQPSGRGDGSDGKADNRLCLAQPGQPNSKTASTNQDARNVSVRGQALIEWLRPARSRPRLRFVPSSRSLNR